MAARINTRFLLIIFIVGSMLAGIIMVTLYFRAAGDVGRHVRDGDERLAEGQYAQAYAAYARAYRRADGSLDYAAKAEEALLQVQPQTADDARDRYTQYLSLLGSNVLYHQTLADQHLRLLDELYKAALLSDAMSYWDELEDAAEEMIVKVSPSDPKAPWGHLYRAIALTNARVYEFASDEDLETARADFQKFCDAFPTEDLGWSTRIEAELMGAENALIADRDDIEVLEPVEALVAEALRAAPDGGHVLVAALGVEGVKVRRGAAEQTDPELLRRSREWMERLVELSSDTDDMLLPLRTANIISRMTFVEERPDSVGVLRNYLDKNPDAHFHRFWAARLQYLDNQLDGAEADAKIVMESDYLPVSFMSQFQPDLRRRCGAVCVDVAFRRWTFAGEVPGDEYAQKMVNETIPQLERLVIDPETDPVLQLARGKAHFANGAYVDASAVLDELVREDKFTDAETLVLNALALERMGQTGRALTRVEEALESLPNNPVLLVNQARLLGVLHRDEDAMQVVNRLLEIAPSNETAQNMRRELMLRGDGAPATDADQLEVALRDAQERVIAGDASGAREVIQPLMEANPQNPRLLNAMVRIEMVDGNTEQAAEYLESALEIAPESATLRNLQYIIENPDPIDRLRRFADDTIEDESERALALIGSLQRLLESQRQVGEFFERNGNEEAAVTAFSLVDRATAAIEEQAAIAERAAPNDPRFIEYRFVRALAAEDWDEVEDIVAIAQDENIDQAQGTIYEGRMHIMRGNAEEAVRSLRQATDLVPFSGQVWRSLAIAYERLGNITEAIDAFETAYNNDPNDLTTIVLYSDLLERGGVKSRALSVARTGHRVHPQNRALRERWLSLEREVGDPAVAIRERRALYELNPNDGFNALQLADALGSVEPTRELILNANDEPRFSQSRWGGLSVVERKNAILAEKARWHEEADTILNDLVEPELRGLAWHERKAELLRVRGAVAEGEALLQGYLNDPVLEEDTRLAQLLAIARYQSRAGRNQLAVRNYTAARGLQTEAMEADRGLAGLFLRIGDWQNAATSMKAVLDERDDRGLRIQYTEALIQLRQYADARTQLDQVIESGGRDFVSTLIEASILEGEADQLWLAGRREEADRKYAEQVATIDEAMGMNPRGLVPHIMQARGLLKEARRTGDTSLLTRALDALSRADEIEAGSMRTSLMRVDVLRAMGNRFGAIQELRNILEMDPRQDFARRSLLRSLTAESQVEEAIAVIQEAIELNPADASWYEELGDIHRQQRDFARAVPAYRQAISIAQASDPTFATSSRVAIKAAISMLAQSDARGAVQFIQQHPKELEDNPLLYQLLANALAVAGQREDALNQMRIAYDIHRKYIGLGEAPPSGIGSWYETLQKLYDSDLASEIGDLEAFALDVAGERFDAYEAKALASLWLMSGQGTSRADVLLTGAIDGLTPVMTTADENLEANALPGPGAGLPARRSTRRRARRLPSRRGVEAQPCHGSEQRRVSPVGSSR